MVPYLALHPMGFSVPPRLRLERWALTPPFHPYPACNFKLKFQARRFVFCGTIRRDASRHRRPRVSCNPPSFVSNYRLRGIAPFGVRTFLPWLAPGAILRPSKIMSKIQHNNRFSRRFLTFLLAPSPLRLAISRRAQGNGGRGQPLSGVQFQWVGALFSP